MKPEEKLVRPYLLSLNLGSVIHEPERNKPPDFLINDGIAVEVRRLNQNRVTQTGYEGLENLRFALRDQIQSLLKPFGPPQSGINWIVNYSFTRPLPPWRMIRPKIISFLRAFRLGDEAKTESSVNIEVCDGLVLELRRAPIRYSRYFVVGGFVDEDTGGFIIPEMLTNIKICIEEKTRRTAAFWHKYPQWWLVLVDRIGMLLDANDQDQLRRNFKSEHRWNRIIIVNSEDPMSAFDLFAQ